MTHQPDHENTADKAAVTPPPALTTEGRLRARVQTLEEDAERNQGLAKVGARCMREGHQGLIESGRATVEGHRFALSVALDLGTGATWDAIHERVKELRRDSAAPAAVSAAVAPPTNQTATDASETPRQWCKCPSCWGWFVEEHPGEDLDELGTDLSWWSGLPEHRDAPDSELRRMADETATETPEEQ
ncbi:hypothetical protein OOK48_35385 [Streptomyces viridodiastaticus]|uniref:hypothetical protein n=1 Tax=Streptomyces albogriseolus TaxID=1887 RepID=UPI0022516528|nr:hypothetical protein [Streptomyces viridodiastaticus]MCX4571606.1 hypothetical protein [Streptomyces viridodiastaticus]